MSDHPKGYCEEHRTNNILLQEIATKFALQQKDIEYLRRDQEVILARFGKHVEDADRDGGWHSRIVATEADIKSLSDSLATFRKFQLLYSAIGGIVGGVVGSKSPELIIGFLKSLGA
jgi:hypothetical protein